MPVNSSCDSAVASVNGDKLDAWRDRRYHVGQRHLVFRTRGGLVAERVVTAQTIDIGARFHARVGIEAGRLFSFKQIHCHGHIRLVVQHHPVFLSLFAPFNVEAAVLVRIFPAKQDAIDRSDRVCQFQCTWLRFIGGVVHKHIAGCHMEYFRRQIRSKVIGV